MPKSKKFKGVHFIFSAQKISIILENRRHDG